MPIVLGNLNSTASNVYVSIGNTAITFLSLCNHTAGNILANVYVVPAGNTAANTNIVLSNIEIQANDTYQFYQGGEKLLLGNADRIIANCNAAGAITTVTSYTTVFPN